MLLPRPEQLRSFSHRKIGNTVALSLRFANTQLSITFGASPALKMVAMTCCLASITSSSRCRFCPVYWIFSLPPPEPLSWSMHSIRHYADLNGAYALETTGSRLIAELQNNALSLTNLGWVGSASALNPACPQGRSPEKDRL